MNLEQLDGFFAALICGPDLVRPSEYLPEIWGGSEMADEEAFASQPQLKDFLDLVMRHWNAIADYRAIRRCASAAAARRRAWHHPRE
jgi:uncharacterized protein